VPTVRRGARAYPEGFRQDRRSIDSTSAERLSLSHTRRTNSSPFRNSNCTRVPPPLFDATRVGGQRAREPNSACRCHSRLDEFNWCVQTVIPQSVNAPSECGNLIGEYARRSFAFNAKGRAISEERARSGRSCPEPRRLREQIADLGPIIAVMKKMDAKGCYQRPVGPLSRNALKQLKAHLAYCEAQAAR
jgi:hypothetical protein